VTSAGRARGGAVKFVLTLDNFALTLDNFVLTLHNFVLTLDNFVLTLDNFVKEMWKLLLKKTKKPWPSFE
jgi:hypothetical protein